MLRMKEIVKNLCLGSNGLVLYETQDFSFTYPLYLIFAKNNCGVHPQTYTVTCTLPTLHPPTLQLPSADPQIEPYIDNLKDFVGH
jgi:hypothetical protein